MERCSPRGAPRKPVGRAREEPEESKRFFTAVNPMNKEHKYPNNIDLEAPRLAWYKQKKWKLHQDTVYWVDFKLTQLRGFKFYLSINIERNHPLRHCIPKAIMMEIGELMYESICVTSTSTDDFLQRELDERIGFRSRWR